MSAALRALQALWRSVGFRLAFYYGLLVAITMLASLAIVYLQTVGVLQQRMVRQVGAALDQMTQRHAYGGLPAVAQAVDHALHDGRGTDTEVYLLMDRDGRVLAGNLAAQPPGHWPQGTPQQRRVVRAGRAVEATVSARTLPDGALLVVGHDLRDQEAIESLVASASAAAGIVAVLLLVGGTFVFRQELERSVGAIRRTAARIAAGNLKERVPGDGDDDDEFARLAHEINAMLDRIESLMDGVRHVSDSIAHDLRTPLMRVLLRLRAAEADAAPTRDAVAAAIREVEELVTRFDKLLSIAEAEAGARRRGFASVALPALADDVVELYDAVAELQGIALVHERDWAPLAQGDPDLLANALANLVDNAIKYGPPGTTVRVRSLPGPGAGWVTLEVSDDGPGVPEAELARLGTRFHRLAPDTPGHGLGLASVRAVVALHHGRLRFERAEPGLRVAIELPAAEG